MFDVNHFDADFVVATIEGVGCQLKIVSNATGSDFAVYGKSPVGGAPPILEFQGTWQEAMKYAADEIEKQVYDETH